MGSSRRTVKLKTARGRQARLVAEIGYGEVEPVTLRMADLQPVMVTGGPLDAEPQVLDCAQRVSIQPGYAVMVRYPMTGWRFTTPDRFEEMFDQAVGREAIYLDDRRWRPLPSDATRRDALLRHSGWHVP